MTTVKEIVISSIGEPAQVKLEKTSKGYNYELNLHGDSLEQCIELIMEAKERIEVVLYERKDTGQL